MTTALHPKGTNAKILLTSVFGPFGQDDEYGSRAINPMELYHNQVTREQGPFSLRMHHRSWGLMLIQENLSASSTLLDFPDRARFIQEIRIKDYDIVGISGIIVNVGKVQELCRLVRLHSPTSTIVVGGHVAAIPGVEQLLDADHIVKGEGVRWFRGFLGEPLNRPIKHPVIPSSFGFRIMGIRAPAGGGNRAATIIPSVGCPMGCDFCTTSDFFGGKGKFVNFYQRGKEVFQVMCEAEDQLGVSSFFIMDENFLLYKKRALELHQHMKTHGKAWSLYVFSSANAIAKYSMRELIDLGIRWIWLGLESPNSDYKKLKGIDTQKLTKELQEHGISVLGSTIVGLPHHTPENISQELSHAIDHDVDFHQFMLYTPMPGTQLYIRMKKEDRILDNLNLADIHGQDKFNFQHPAISREASKEILDDAFRRDYDCNGPSLYRLIRTKFNGWVRYHDDADPRIRAMEAIQKRGFYGFGIALWVMEHYLRSSHPSVSQQIRALRLDVEREMGGFRALINKALGPILLWIAQREGRRFPKGRRLEPRTFLNRVQSESQKRSYSKLPKHILHLSQEEM